MKAKVMLVVSRLQRGGLEQVLFDVATGLTPRGFEFEVVALTGEGARDNEFREAGIPVRVLEGSASFSPLANLTCFGALMREIRRWRPDVVQTHHFFSGVLGRAAGWACGVPALVQSEHNFYLWKGWAARTVDRFLELATNRYAVPSVAVARHVAGIHAAPARRIEVLPNGRSLAGPALAREAARERLGLPATGAVVGFVGRLAESKRPVDFVHMARALGRPGVTFAVAGAGPLETECRRQAEGLPVVFAGDVADAARLMPAFDVLVACSSEEGFGLAVAEAVMAGVPVVMTDLPAFRELLPERRAFVPVGDVGALAIAVAAALDDPRQSTGDREQLARRLSPEAMLERYENLYDGLLPRARSSAFSSRRSSFTAST